MNINAIMLDIGQNFVPVNEGGLYHTLFLKKKQKSLQRIKNRAAKKHLGHWSEREICKSIPQRRCQ